MTVPFRVYVVLIAQTLTWKIKRESSGMEISYIIFCCARNLRSALSFKSTIQYYTLIVRVRSWIFFKFRGLLTSSIFIHAYPTIKMRIRILDVVRPPVLWYFFCVCSLWSLQVTVLLPRYLVLYYLLLYKMRPIFVV